MGFGFSQEKSINGRYGTECLNPTYWKAFSYSSQPIKNGSIDLLQIENLHSKPAAPTAFGSPINPNPPVGPVGTNFAMKRNLNTSAYQRQLATASHEARIVSRGYDLLYYRKVARANPGHPRLRRLS